MNFRQEEVVVEPGSPKGWPRRGMSAAMKMTGARVAGAAAILAAALTAAALPAWPQSYPSRPIRLIVSFPPGGTGDTLGRIIAGELSNELGQSFAVENRSGAGGTIGARDRINAEPDGYTLTVAQTPEIAINPYFMKDVGYDPLRDYALSRSAATCRWLW